MNYLIVKRPGGVLLRQVVNLVVMVGVSAYLLYSYQSSGWTYDITAGIIFAVWACYILWHILSRPISFKEVADGFCVHRWFRWQHFKWADLVAKAEMDDTSRIVFVVARQPGDAKDTYVGISRRVLGEQFGDVIALINDKRPDLPIFAQGEIQKPTEPTD